LRLNAITAVIVKQKYVLSKLDIKTSDNLEA